MANAGPAPLGPEPVSMTCPYCHEKVTTEVGRAPSLKTWLFCVCLTCLCWPCLWIPFCIDDCQTLRHKCPRCGKNLGRA